MDQETELERLRARVGALEEALRRREEQVRLASEHAHVALAIFDREMRYLFHTRQWLDNFELPEQDLTGRNHYEVFPGLPESLLEVHRRCLAGATEGGDDAYPLADGRVQWMSWKAGPWRRADGEIGGIVVSSQVITALKEMEARLLAQQEAIQRMSTPIVPITDEVLVMPLIGALEPDRCQQAMEALLGALVERQARTAILDITGVPEVDAQVASALLKIAQGARLLGAEVVLTGLRPEVAQALVSLDVDLSGMVTRRDLQSGVAFATAARDARAPGAARVAARRSM